MKRREAISALAALGMVPSGATAQVPNSNPNVPSLQKESESTYQNSRFSIDGKSYIKCKFENCELIYEGGSYELRDNTFTNCRLILKGAAGRTFDLIKAWHATTPKNAPPRSEA